MSDFPTPSDYQAALQAPETAFADPVLQNAEPRTNVLGLPQPITGAFAAVFPMTTDTGRRVAVKCFLKEDPDQQARYEAVADALDSRDLDAFVPFTYRPRGIRVKGTTYPILKMEWIEGAVLNRFVQNHLDRPDVLRRLAAAWADLMDTLDGEPLAHGDLQHGNVLVQWTGDEIRLRLVDYDTMYVPALDGMTSAEVGHRNYQHPDRTDTDVGPFLDRFAALVIHTALRACVVHPGLWKEYDTGENLLFRDIDFYDPEQSPLFDDLAALDPLEPLVAALRTACYVDPADVPSLADARAGRTNGDPLPRPRRRRPTDRSERPAFDRAVLPVALGSAIAVGGLAGAGWPLLAATLGTVIGVGGGTLAARRYRTLSIVRRRRRLRHEEARCAEAIQTLERERDRLQERRDELLDSIEERRAERLEEVQEAALRDCLKHHFIGEIRDLDGIIHKHVVRLKAANIRTAHEATPEALAAVRRISDEARERIRLWRRALVRRYETNIPDELSPAEERRLQRIIEHRVDDLDAQRARIREKIQVQESERERARERLDDTPSLSPDQYVRYLFRLASLPRLESAPRASRSESETTRSEKAAVTTPPPPAQDEGSWWEPSRRPEHASE